MVPLLDLCHKNKHQHQRFIDSYVMHLFLSSFPVSVMSGIKHLHRGLSQAVRTLSVSYGSEVNCRMTYFVPVAAGVRQGSARQCGRDDVPVRSGCGWPCVGYGV
jgi:hypothetical protein